MPGDLELPHGHPAKNRPLRLEYPEKRCPGDVLVKERVGGIIACTRNNENKGTHFLPPTRLEAFRYVIGRPSNIKRGFIFKGDNSAY
jgi:hypothetical protein